MSASVIKSVRGMRDIFQPESDQYLALSEVIHKVLYQFGYHYAEFPLLEKTALFKRTIGDETDIVSKEMYTFEDRNSESLTLRPEGTASAVRAIIENGLLQENTRLFLEGPMFRYERPQKGRYRQFKQISVEAFGFSAPILDIELIQIAYSVFQELGIDEYLTLQVNTLGLPEERKEYLLVLVDYLSKHKSELDEDSLRRLETNPLRILDSKNKSVQNCVDNAPKLKDFLGTESKAHFSFVTSALDALKIPYVINEKLVRGLDYYCHSVFEWVTDELGAQGTVCAGGRYDGLVEQLGGKPTPGAGFAFGIDRILLLREKMVGSLYEHGIDIYIICATPEEAVMALSWTSELRSAFKSLKIVTHNEYQSLKNQFKKADKMGAKVVLLFAESEMLQNKVTLKKLSTGEQVVLNKEELLNYIKMELVN